MSGSADEEKMQRDHEEQTRLADVAEASAVFMHELGNVLNNVLLNSKMLMMEVPKEHHARLQENCRLIESAAWRMRELSDLRSAKRPGPGPVDLNAIVQSGASLRGPIDKNLQENLPAFSAREVDVARLVRLLVDNGRLAQNEEDAPVLVQTRQEGTRVVLVIADHGPALLPSDRPLPFNPFAPPRPGQSGLELAICKNLARQMDALIQAESWEQGVQVVVSWPSLATV